MAPADTLSTEASIPASVINSPTAAANLTKTQASAVSGRSGLAAGMRDAVNSALDAAKSARAFVARTVGDSLSSAATAVVGAGGAVMEAVGVGDGSVGGGGGGGKSDDSDFGILHINATLKKHFFGGWVGLVKRAVVNGRRGLQLGAVIW